MDTDSNLEEVTPEPQSAPESEPGEQISEPTASIEGQGAEGQPEAPQPSQPAGQEEPEGPDLLSELALRSQAARLPAADEERMCALLREALLSGKAGMNSAIENLPRIPWIVGVRSVESAWTEMKTTARTQLLKGLADTESDSTKRMRLSLARALYKLDPATGLKLAISVCKELKDRDSGLLSPKHAQIFANVFIGKAKPWIGQMPLADLKPADGDLLVHCAVLAVFSLPHSPLSQIGVLKWAADRLSKLHPAALAAVVVGLPRWSTRWQNSLRNEVEGLPGEVLAVLKPAEPHNPEARPERGSQETPGSEEASGTEEPKPRGDRPRRERPVYEPRPQRSPEQQRPTEQGQTESELSPEDPERAQDRAARPERQERSQERSERQDRSQDRQDRPERESRKERPVYQSRTTGAAAPQNFNLGDTLRVIEAHVQSLRSELTAAQAKLRQREEPARKEKRAPERTTIIIPGEPTVEELARLNVQLEGRIAELQQRITDLGADAEDRAASMGVQNEEPTTDTDQRLRTLLAFKLQEDYADYLALETESTSVVVQQHYRSLLMHIFEVLKHEEVPLQG